VDHRSSFVRVVLALALSGVLTASCSAAEGTPAPVPYKVAFFEDLSVPDSLDVVLPAWLSTQAFARAKRDAGLPAPLFIESFDTRGDPAAALEEARTVAADPTFVAVIVAPFWVEPSSVADVWARAGIPVLDLSTVGVPSRASPSAVWLSFVADLARQSQAAGALATAQARSGPLCQGGDGTPWSSLVEHDVDPDLVTPPVMLPEDPAAAADAAHRAGCPAVLWTGFGPGAQDLRSALHGAITVVGTDAMKTWPYLVGASAATSTLVTCSCEDVNTSTGTARETFINRYQVATGLTPGVYAAEAWDVAALLARAARDAPGGREALAAWLGALHRYRGVAGVYRFGLDPPAPVNAFHAVGSRWIPFDDSWPPPGHDGGQIGQGR
jgi:hypothetical protein